MIKDLDRIVLTEDLPALGLKRGDVGTVVLLHPAGECEVEVMTLDGETLAVTSVPANQVRPVGSKEIALPRALV